LQNEQTQTVSIVFDYFVSTDNNMQQGISKSIALTKEQRENFINRYYKFLLVPIVYGFHRLFFFLTDPFADPLSPRTLYDIIIQNFGLLVFSFIIITGSIRISNRLNQKLPWANSPALRALVQLLAQLMLATVWIFAYQFIIAYVLYQKNLITIIGASQLPPEIRFLLWRFFFSSIMISLLVSIIITARNFRLKAAEIELDTARLKQTTMQAELQSLKLQLDPHFMFNNFSTLSALIEENKEQAQLFVEHLSRVYRYMVQHIHSDTITLQKELRFIDSYMYLINIRHGDHVTLTVNVPEAFLQNGIPPITLQLLIENAIKHNIASAKQPLYISISIQNDRLVVTNNLQRISGSPVTSSKIGLENIKARYRIVSGLEPEVNESSDSFSVTLPLLD
jgi:two-component system, LytTR family, sensor kinase